MHWMPCKNPCGLYIHLAFTYSVGPSSVVWSELGPVLAFPPIRVLEMYWSRALSLMCEVAFSSPHAHFLSYLNGYLVYYKLIYIHPHRASHGGRRLPLISQWFAQYAHLKTNLLQKLNWSKLKEIKSKQTESFSLRWAGKKTLKFTQWYFQNHVYLKSPLQRRFHSPHLGYIFE